MKSTQNHFNSQLAQKNRSKYGILKTELSPATVMLDYELACFHSVKYVLYSHKELSNDDIRYASNYISSFYSYSLDILSLNSSESQNLFTHEHLLRFLVYANQKSVGNFALIYNQNLNIAIKTKNKHSLNQILLSPNEVFTEVYDNSYLLATDRDFMIRLIEREAQALSKLFDYLRTKINYTDPSDDYSQLFNEKINNSHTALGKLDASLSMCYDEVCIQDSKSYNDEIRRIMSRYEKVPHQVYTIDKPESGTRPQAYCFETMELIEAITSNQINPRTGEAFSDYSLQLIHHRFRKEIAMYLRYKQLISGVQ